MRYSKLHFAHALESAVDKVRIAKREVSELNKKNDPEKEILCHASILKAEYFIEKCDRIIEDQQKKIKRE